MSSSVFLLIDRLLLTASMTTCIFHRLKPKDMYTTISILFAISVGLASCSPVAETRTKNIYQVDHGNVGVDLCPSCIDEALTVVNVLLNAILDEGILATCASLCDVVANKTGSKIMGDVCAVVCDAVGVDEFVKEIIRLDPDPIWYCQMAKMCPINDQGDAKFRNYTIFPHTGNRGTKFVVDCSFQTQNGTGTGMLRIYLVDPKKQSVMSDFLIEARKPGVYTERIALDTIGQNCDPSQPLCDDWPVGTYNVTALLCNGECESHHPHSALYDLGIGTFTVTQ